MTEANYENQETNAISLPMSWHFPENLQSRYANLYDTSDLSNPRVLTIDGLLPNGKYLKHPISVRLENDEGEILVSEPRFSLHASGLTLQEAIGAFKSVLSDEFDALAEDEHKLAPRLIAQLQYLRNIIGI